jgi:hypothetical protein
MDCFFWLPVLGSPCGPRAKNDPQDHFLNALFEPSELRDITKLPTKTDRQLFFWLPVLGSNQRPNPVRNIVVKHP